MGVFIFWVYSHFISMVHSYLRIRSLKTASCLFGYDEWQSADGQNIQSLRKRLDWHPCPQMSKLSNMCVTCQAVRFDFFCAPSQPLEEENNFEILEGAGDKVVQGLNNLSIYGSSSFWNWRFVQKTLPQMLDEHFSEVAKHLGANSISTSNISNVQVVKVTR